MFSAHEIFSPQAKKWRPKYYLSLICLLALTGCSLLLPRPNVTKISLPAQPIIKDNFSLLPLNEEGWVMGYQKNDLLMLGARGGTSGETRIISGFVRPMPKSLTSDDFSAYAKSIKKIEDPKRYELLKQEAQKDSSTEKDCMKVRTTLKDLAPNVPSKRLTPMTIDSLYWVCKHPNGGKAVIVEYSSRFYPGDEELSFEKNAETIFQGLKLIAQ